MSIRIITVPADDEQPITTSQSPGNLAALQAAVDGYVELIGTGNICIWLDEDGKINKRPPNRRATKLAHRIKAISAYDTIVGDVVITGFDESTGDNADAPETALTYLRSLSE